MHRPSRQPDARRCHGGSDAGLACRCRSSIWRSRRARPPRAAFSVNFAAGNVVQDETIRITGPVLNLNGTADFDRNGDADGAEFPVREDGAAERSCPSSLRAARSGDDYVLRGRSLDGSRSAAPAPTRRRAAVQPQPAGRHAAGRIPYQRQAGPAGDARRRFDRALQSGSRRHRQPASARSTSAAASARERAARRSPPTSKIRGKARKVTVTSGDAGLLARGLFAFESMRGGELAATINLPGQAVRSAQSQCAAPISPAR